MSDITATSPRGTTEERAFVAAVAASTHDQTVRLVFADWLDEHGRGAEAAILRDPAAAPILTPVRVLAHWGAFRSASEIVFVQTADGELSELDRVRVSYDSRNALAAALYQRLEEHRVARHWHRVQPGQSPHPGALVLTDEEARLAGIDRLPLAPGEPSPLTA